MVGIFQFFKPPVTNLRHRHRDRHLQATVTSGLANPTTSSSRCIQRCSLHRIEWPVYLFLSSRIAKPEDNRSDGTTITSATRRRRRRARERRTWKREEKV